MDNRQLVDQLIGQVLNGQVMEAFETFYADEVEMQENGNPPTIGKTMNRIREQMFVDSIAEFHKGEANSVIVDGDQAAIAWVMDFTDKDGTRKRIDQVALQTWKNGKVVKERFYYDSATVGQPEAATV